MAAKRTTSTKKTPAPKGSAAKETATSPLPDAERACAEARGDEAAFTARLAVYANLLAEQGDPLGELLRLSASGAEEEALTPLRDACIAPLLAVVPTVEALAALPGLSEDDRRRVPISEGRMAAPFELEWQGGLVVQATFELYAEPPLADISAAAYRAFLAAPACRLVRRLSIGNVACREPEDSALLGDPTHLLAEEGVPPYLIRLDLDRYGPISHSGDTGYVPIESLSPIVPKIGHVKELDIGGCEDMKKLALPNLRVLRLIDNVRATTLEQLARANLPSLEHLVLWSHNAYYPPEERYHAVATLLRSKKLPRLSNLELMYLDLDESMRENLETDDEAAGPPESWVDMIADSWRVEKLKGLTLQWNDDDREAPRLLERAEVFHHLERLELYGDAGNVTLKHPTRESIAAALGRAQE